MRALAVMPHEHEDLRRPADAVHPVRRPCAELRHLARRQHEVLVTEEEAEPAAEDVKPVVSLVRSGLGNPRSGSVRWYARGPLPPSRLSGPTRMPLTVRALRRTRGSSHGSGASSASAEVPSARASGAR